MSRCNHCHTCGANLEHCLDGEEYCPQCKSYRRYRSHGWGQQGEGEWYCPKAGDTALPAPDPVK